MPDQLLQEMRERYERIGQSPLLEHTEAQARALQQLSGRPTRVAMRLSEPRLLDVVADLGPNDGVCLIPIAPFSVGVYASAAARELEQVPPERRPQLAAVEPWGTNPALIREYVAGIEAARDAHFPRTDPEKVTIILTAHSLPNAVIRSGDQYARLFQTTADLVAADLGVRCETCYQSQGADGADWLGPTLLEVMQECSRREQAGVLVAPIGFLAEHIETLYDLDVEARAQAEALGLGFARAAALCSSAGLVEAIHQAAEATISGADPKSLRLLRSRAAETEPQLDQSRN